MGTASKVIAVTLGAVLGVSVGATPAEADGKGKRSRQAQVVVPPRVPDVRTVSLPPRSAPTPSALRPDQGALVAPYARVLRSTPVPVEIRTHGTSARELGCSPYVEQCEGITTMRQGLAVVDLGVPVGARWQFVGVFHSSSRPSAERLASQVAVGAAGRRNVGGAWLQAGAGIVAHELVRNPKNLTTEQLLADPTPTVFAGVGSLVDMAGPTRVSLDTSVGVTRESDPSGPARLYQVTASATRVF